MNVLFITPIVVAICTLFGLLATVCISYLHWVQGIRQGIAARAIVECVDTPIVENSGIVYELPQFGCRVRVKYKFPTLAELVSVNPMDYRVNLVC